MLDIQTFSQLERSGLSLNYERFESKSDGISIPLTISEFKILFVLLKRSGLVVSREHLKKVVAPNHTIIDRNVDVHVRAIRRKLGLKGSFIRTVRGLGYRWDEERMIEKMVS